MIQRVMPGVANLSGRTVGTLRIGAMTARHPAPRYAVVCAKCGTQTTESQARLTSGIARCKNSGCGKDGIREAAAETPAKLRQREESEEAAKRQAQGEREAAKVAEAEVELNNTATKVAQIIRERIATQRDDEVYVSPELTNAKTSRAEAIKLTTEGFKEFAANNEWFHNSEANRRAVISYLERNGLEIVDAEMWRRAAQRLAEFGLLEARPAPAPSPTPRVTTVNLSVESAEPQTPAPIRPETFVGFDPQTGLERSYTRLEVGNMSGDEYRRAFRIYRDALALPNHAAF